MSGLQLTTVIGATLFLIYCAIIFFINNRKVPESVSATSYILTEHKKGYHFGFSLICLIVACTLFPMWISITPEVWMFLTFLACVGILFAGSTPFFREGLEKPIHYIAGGIAGLAYIAWFILVGGWIWLCVVIAMVGISLLWFWDWKPYVFWLEVWGLVILTYRLMLY